MVELSKIPQFSYLAYHNILEAIASKLKNFRDINDSEDFIILRHDVEFSVLRAHIMAKIERQKNIFSTYLFQVASSAYNPFSKNNKELIGDIRSMGHTVGLHFYVTHIDEGDKNALLKELDYQKRLFEHGLNLECPIFSFHRPPSWVLENRDNCVGEMINAYGDKFFEFSNNPIKVKYLADSMRSWNYGHPLDFLDSNKMQLLIHPDYWTESGEAEIDFFMKLISEKKCDFIETLNQETKNFSKYRKLFN